MIGQIDFDPFDYDYDQGQTTLIEDFEEEAESGKEQGKDASNACVAVRFGRQDAIAGGGEEEVGTAAQAGAVPSPPAEQPFHIRQFQLHVCWPAVVALTGIRHLFHLTQ